MESFMQIYFMMLTEAISLYSSLYDISTAFDTVDHTNLLGRLGFLTLLFFDSIHS